MDKLVDYVQWMGDFPISMTGFLDADALIFCALSYFDLSPVFSDGAEDHKVRDCQQMIDENQVRVMITGGDEGYPELLAAAVRSKRFGDLRMSDYRDVFRTEPPLQFSAVCFHDDQDFSFLAYRGTDSSLVGWKEDFMISFTRTEAQEMALEYAKAKIHPGRRWYIGGQSKGSNLALYASCLLDDEKWDAVERLYLLDGPGFCPEVMDVSLIERIDPKTVQVVPRFCVVGKLFAPQITDTRIIQSSAFTFLQHAMITWGIDHGKLALSEEHDPESLIVNRTMDEWIRDISQEERPIFIDELFGALSAGGADTLEALKTGGREGLEAILKRLGDASDTTKKTLSDLPKYAMKVRIDDLRKKISDGLDEWKKKKENKS
ncbi:MAG: DUF2974 domain-containing protein [Firmicutes bacterium]|nr:DUF2974 domain-containing protein [Bacillota bacterium]